MREREECHNLSLLKVSKQQQTEIHEEEKRQQ
jgi:hypothetical protein